MRLPHLTAFAALALATVPATAQITGTNTTSRAPGSGATTAGTRPAPNPIGTAMPAPGTVGPTPGDADRATTPGTDTVSADILDRAGDTVALAPDGANTVPDTMLGVPGGTLGDPDGAGDATGIEGGAATGATPTTMPGSPTPGGR